VLLGAIWAASRALVRRAPQTAAPLTEAEEERLRTLLSDDTKSD
jgi:hypothetical protein